MQEIDDLVAQVRDPLSRSHIREAVVAWRAGANRAAVTTCWVAVCVDVVAKLRELESHGDRAAKRYLEKLDNAARSPHIQTRQRLEQDLLEELSREPFHLLTDRELIDFLRLKQDRNHCAHPTLHSDGEQYQPSDEQVRAHLTNVLRHLLIRAPVEGNTAVARFAEEIARPSFPRDRRKAADFVRTRYVENGRPTLLRQLVRQAVRALLSPEVDVTDHWSRALRALWDVRAETVTWQVKDVLTRSDPDDDQLVRLVTELGSESRFWEAMPEHLLTRVDELLVAGLVSPATAAQLVCCEHLRPSLATFAERWSAADLAEAAGSMPSPWLVDLALTRLETSDSYRTTLPLVRRVLCLLTEHFDVDDARRILTAIAENRNVSGSFGVVDLLGYLVTLDDTLREKTADGWRALPEKVIADLREDGDPRVKEWLDRLGIAAAGDQPVG